MAKLIDLTNQRFGRLVAVRYEGERRWLCACDCGVLKVIRASSLGKSTRSCGCFHREMVGNMNATHRLSGTATHQIWVQMKRRCYNPKDKGYKHYGARGITVCERWRKSFENFLADMGERPSNQHSIDRYPDNDGNYEPTNCRWATPKQQANNTRRNRKISHNGITKNLNEWAAELGMSRATLESRIGTNRFRPDQIFSAKRLPKGPSDASRRVRDSNGRFI